MTVNSEDKELIVVLEMPRGWLRPEPVLRRDGILELFVTMPGENLFDEPLRVPLRLREGHSAAGHIIAMLAPSGVRHIAPDAALAVADGRAPPAVGLLPFVVLAVGTAAALGLVVVAAARSAPWHPLVTDPPLLAQTLWEMPDTDGQAIAGRGGRAPG